MFDSNSTSTLHPSRAFHRLGRETASLQGDKHRDGEDFHFGRRGNSSRCAEAAPAFRRPDHARNLRARCWRCTAQSGSESLNKTGELRAIVRKPHFVRKSCCKSLKTIRLGRDGGDRNRDLSFRPLFIVQS